MKFTSTRNELGVESAKAISQGLSLEGGLFVPKSFPSILGKIDELINANYMTRAFEVLKLYLTDFSDDEIMECVSGAYEGTFDNNEPAPVVELENGLNVLELWHGPTCAFKDMALQLLPFLLTKSAKKVDGEKTMVILVATSGDTGKAALDGFADVDKTKIIVFYPEDGVSPMQKLQMKTQKGNNVAVCAIKGNFDDAQSGVKQIFADESVKEFLANKNLAFSSANSINFGRLVPQIVYYVSSYCDLIKEGKLKAGEPMNVVVPTGNFGNILAAYYAKEMGIPINKFICASNKNNILADFIKTGVYDRNRSFYATNSPSMDILISSNLERLLYELSGKSESTVASLMNDLNSKGVYTVDEEIASKLKKEFFGGFCDDEMTQETIKNIFKKYNYLCDTHTGVAFNVYEQYIKETGDTTPTVVVSTASPYKFAQSVLPAVFEGELPTDEFESVEMLSVTTSTRVPEALASLKEQEVIHNSIVEKEEMIDFIKNYLN